MVVAPRGDEVAIGRKLHADDVCGVSPQLAHHGKVLRPPDEAEVVSPSRDKG